MSTKTKEFNLPSSGILVRMQEPKGRHFTQASRLMQGDAGKYFPAIFHQVIDVAERDGLEVTSLPDAPQDASAPAVVWKLRQMEWFEDLPLADFSDLVARMGN